MTVYAHREEYNEFKKLGRPRGNFYNNKKWRVSSNYKIRNFTPNNLNILRNVKRNIKNKYGNAALNISLYRYIEEEINKFERNIAVRKIQRAWRESHSRVNEPHKRRLNNPAWVKRYLRAQVASLKKAIKRTPPPLPKIPKKWGLWSGPYNNKEYISPNWRWKYYTNSNRLVNTINNKTYTNARKRFTIPF